MKKTYAKPRIRQLTRDQVIELAIHQADSVQALYPRRKVVDTGFRRDRNLTEDLDRLQMPLPAKA